MKVLFVLQKHCQQMIHCRILIFGVKYFLIMLFFCIVKRQKQTISGVNADFKSALEIAKMLKINKSLLVLNLESNYNEQILFFKLTKFFWFETKK